MQKSVQSLFISEYGWAILVVFIAVFCLAYFGMVTFEPNACNFETGIICRSYFASKVGIGLELQNDFEYNVKITALNLTGAGCFSEFNVSLAPEISSVFYIPCQVSGEKLMSDIIVFYLRTDLLSNSTAKGKIVADINSN